MKKRNIFIRILIWIRELILGKEIKISKVQSTFNDFTNKYQHYLIDNKAKSNVRNLYKFIRQELNK